MRLTHFITKDTKGKQNQNEFPEKRRRKRPKTTRGKVTRHHMYDCRMKCVIFFSALAVAHTINVMLMHVKMLNVIF